MTQPAKAEPQAETKPAAKKSGPTYTGRERQDRVKIPLLPQIFLTESVVALAFVVITVVICAYWYSAPLEEHARPFVTPQHTKSPWYFLWLQGLLKVTDKFWAGVAIPGLVIIVLLLLPWMDRNPSRRMKDRVFAITAYSLSVLMVGTLTYMGQPIWGIDTSPPVEIQTQMRPAIRNLPAFQDLLGCDGQVLQVARDAVLPVCMRDAPGLRRAYFHYLNLVEEFEREKPDRFRGVTAQMTIQRWQPAAGDPNLMRVTFDLRFTKDIIDTQGRKTGEGPDTYQFTYYIHRDTHGEGEPLVKF